MSRLTEEPAFENGEIEQAEPLSEEEMAMLGATVKKASDKRGDLPPLDQSASAQAYRFAKKNKVFTASAAVLVVSVCIVLVVALVMGTIGLRHFFLSKEDYTVYLGERTQYTASNEQTLRGDTLYVDLMCLYDFLGLTVSGSDTKKIFTAQDTTSLCFENGSNTATVNGTLFFLNGTAEVSNTVCFVPLAFLQQAIKIGARISVNEVTHEITVKRQYYRNDTDRAVALVFHDEGMMTAEEPLMDFPDVPVYLPFSYPFDVTEELEFMYAEYLILVNKEHPLSAADAPTDLTLLSDLEGCVVAQSKTDTCQLREDAARSLAVMMRAMYAESSDARNTYVTSAYRSYAHQNWLFYTYYYEQEKAAHPEATDEEIFAIVATYSARPGESEHESGLCIDFSDPQVGGELVEEFENTAAFAWLSANAHKYGFILRYPKDKVDTTGYQYEPWHYRFVGVEAAAAIYEDGLCLEEYLAASET